LVHFGGIAQQVQGTTRLLVGVAGFGGLGHMAVKIAKKLGHHVTVISSSPKKEKLRFHLVLMHLLSAPTKMRL